MGFNLDKYMDRLHGARTEKVKGRLTSVVGLALEAVLPGTFVGEQVEISGKMRPPLRAEVVGFRRDRVLLMPLGDPSGLGPESEVIPLGRPAEVMCGPGLLGKVLNGLGEPADGSSLQGELRPVPLYRQAPDPLSRIPVNKPLSLGVRVLDGLLTAGEGQRLGLFAAAGVGKSTLLAQIARNTEADVTVLALVGERGREVGEFIDGVLGTLGIERSVVVCATSDQPALVRKRAAYTATSIAEYFRDSGKRVLLLLDSLTRVARAQREIGSTAGEPPVRRGFPPSAFAMLPGLLERAGNSNKGTMTAIYTVLMEGDDQDEPVADEVRGILDGHIVLSRTLASRGWWPAVDVNTSLSRVFDKVAGPEQVRAAQELRRLIASYEQKRDLIALGAYSRGSDRYVDRAMDLMPAIERYLTQGPDEQSTMAQAVEGLVRLVEAR